MQGLQVGLIEGILLDLGNRVALSCLGIKQLLTDYL